MTEASTLERPAAAPTARPAHRPLNAARIGAPRGGERSTPRRAAARAQSGFLCDTARRSRRIKDRCVMDAANTARLAGMHFSFEKMIGSDVEDARHHSLTDPSVRIAPGPARPDLALLEEDLMRRDLDAVIAAIIAAELIDPEDIRLYSPEDLFDYARRYL